MTKLTDTQKKTISFLADMLKEISEESITDKKRKDYRNRLKANIKQYDEKIIQYLQKKFESLRFSGAGAAGASGGDSANNANGNVNVKVNANAVPAKKSSKLHSQKTRALARNSNSNSNSNSSDTSNDTSDKKKPAKSNVNVHVNVNAIVTAPERKSEQIHARAPVGKEQEQQSKQSLEINANDDNVEIQLMPVHAPRASKPSQPQSQSLKSKRNNVHVEHGIQDKENSDPHPNEHANGMEGYKSNSNNDHKFSDNLIHDHEEKEMIHKNERNMGSEVDFDNSERTLQLTPQPLMDVPNTNTNAKSISLSMPYTSPKEQPAQQHQHLHLHQQIIDPHGTNQVIPQNDFRYMYLERKKFEKEGYVQPPSCLSCSIRTNNKTLARPTTSTTPNRHCNNRVMWLRDASIGLDPENWDGHLLYVTCAGAQAWMRNEAVDHLKWDAETKVLYSI
jgi:hypothetical protein